MYLINKKAYISQILPPHWRVESWKINILSVILKPLFDLIDTFNQYREETLSKINLNCQVIVLERHLNMILGYKLNYISISDGANVNEVFINAPSTITQEQLILLNKEIKKYIASDKQYQIKYYG
jgi:hypothetical protein